MADISKELDNFKNAKYGKDVRGSMVSLAEKLNKESSDTVKTVSEYGDAEVSREQAEQDRQNAENARQQDFETMQSDSQVATIAANKAAERAEQAATGDISLKTVTFEVAAARSGIVSGDTLGVAFGKLAKYCTDIEDHAFNALVNNGLANIAGISALDAVQANPDVADTLAYKIAQNLAAITSLNSKIAQNLEAITSLNSKIQAGTSASIDIKPNSMGMLDITFDKAFSKVPNIVCSIKSGTSNYKYGNVAAFVDFNTVTKTGFTIKIANASESLVSPNVTWIAYEQ